MSKLQLYVLDNDMAYSDRLALYVRATEYADRVQIKLFSQVELVQQVLEDPQREGVLLISEAYYPLFQNHRSSLYTMFLSENISNTNISESLIPFLFRYQPLQQLLSRILALYAEGLTYEFRHSNTTTKTRVISVYSSSGNTGKSITSVHMAKQLAFRGERVLYLSLETISAASQWLKGEGGSLSRLLYYLKGSPEWIGSKLELLKSHDATFQFDYLTPHDQLREMQEMSGDHVKQLITAIVNLSVYDTLIVDLEASIHPRIVKCLELSDTIIWLVKDDWQDAFKTKTLYKQMSAYPHINFVMTSYRGSPTHTFDFLDKKMVYKLPYIPEWKMMSSAVQVWQSDIFSEQVYSMLKAVIQNNIVHPKEGAANHIETRAVS
jgi:MinD-like ATPase involved in chromosome partitioning or flagellar assembly